MPVIIFACLLSQNELNLVKSEDLSEQIRAIKRAWEEMEPGRAERAGLSRLRYLEQQVSKSESRCQVTTAENETIERSRPSTRSSTVRGKPNNGKIIMHLSTCLSFRSGRYGFAWSPEYPNLSEYELVRRSRIRTDGVG
ncbi:hypothetical protein FBUS_10941 [Fasciolopsis buskii]|uniref:Uncharacterized protein n=1 Tax=Fasciolopsis buskii TaxID=27845 RepID=A0A8E0RWC3_9TREM|nr:hypothetical protein FBUS_10941 [Fasciolopsis buski]